MTKEVKTQQLKEAQHQAQAMVETVTNVQNRIDHYNDLISSGLTGWETTEQISRHTASVVHGIAAVTQLAGAIAHLAPDVGSPFAMKYGGKAVGDSISNFATMAGYTATVADVIAASAGLEASHQRRDQDWRHQLLLAQQELKQVQQQCFAADTRAAIAEKELDIHQTSTDQADRTRRVLQKQIQPPRPVQLPRDNPDPAAPRPPTTSPRNSP